LVKNGEAYFGDLKNGRKDGLGILVKKGLEFKGYWKDDVPDTFGINTISEESYYIGELNFNRKQGVGREISIRNEYEYIGEFKDDHREGFGVVRDSEGIYHGNWVKGLRHGRGLLTMKNGSYYLGMWNLGKREGLGIFFKSSSNKIFKAE